MKKKGAEVHACMHVCIMLNFEREEKSEYKDIHIHNILCTYVCICFFLQKRKGLRTNQKLVNMITYKK